MQKERANSEGRGMVFALGEGIFIGWAQTQVKVMEKLCQTFGTCYLCEVHSQFLCAIDFPTGRRAKITGQKITHFQTIYHPRDTLIYVENANRKPIYINTTRV